jgi:hypothetical protein
VMKFDENTFPVVVLGVQLLLDVSATSIIGGMWLVSLRQTAVAARWSGSRVSLLWAFPMQVAASAPLTADRLPTDSPDVAQL